MATKKATPAKIDATPVNAPDMEATPVTVSAPVLEAPETATAKIEEKKGAKTMQNEKQPANVTPVETAPETVTAPVPALAEVDPVNVEAKKAEITRKIEVLEIRCEELVKIDNDGEELAPTNWSKNETTRGNETIGGRLRKRLLGYDKEINSLKRELKCLYFTLDPVLSGLLTSDNETVVTLVNACIENMRNVVIINDEDETDAEAIKILYNAGVERIGVNADYDCNKVSRVVRQGGFKYWDADEDDGQPAHIDKQEIAGLDPVPACDYYVYIRK